MKKNTLSRVALALFAAAGILACSKEPIPEPADGNPEPPVTPTGQYISFIAGTPEAEGTPAPASRAGYDSASGHAVWEPGDSLNVFIAGDSQNQKLSFTQKAGTLSADRRTVEYEGTLLNPVTGIQTVYAVYPYDLSTNLSASKIMTLFPGRQVYSPDGYTGIPLFGKYEGDIAGLHFKGFMNPFAVIELRLASEESIKVTRIVFQGNNGENVSGYIYADMSGARPVITEYPYNASKSIVLDCGEGVTLSTTPKSFYIAIPAREYAKGYRFDIRTDTDGANGIVLNAKSAGVSPDANTIVRTPVKTLTAAQAKTVIPDANFRNWLATNGWVTIDDEVSGAVTIVNTTGTSMDIGSESISSLEGIEYFPQLTALICSRNRLTALDLSKNTALQTLDCSRNLLTTLDVSKNTALQTLECSNNRLTALDLSNNTVLQTLQCYGNQLTALDPSKNTVLQTLQCYGNQLTALDLSKNTILQTLHCNSNQLTALDLSKNTELTHLNCGTNSLSALDLSANTALTSLYCHTNLLTALDVTKNTKLTELSCYKNQLTALDVTKNTELTQLYCYTNLLTALDVTKNTKLTELYCSTNSLTALDVTKNTKLIYLHCDTNLLTVLDVSQNTALGILQCYGNRLTALDATTMAEPQMYALYCGQQTDAGGETGTIQLTLTEAQRNRWESALSQQVENTQVAVTFVP